MDQLQVARAVLSVSTPGVHLGDDAEARRMARAVNEFAAEARRTLPDRFGFFATLLLPDVDGAVDELANAYDELDADGVVLLANVHGRYLGDPHFDPVFDELDRRGAVVFVHPSHLPADPVPGLPAFVADFLLDTTRAALSLCRSGTMDRCPNLRVILSHAGGFVPYAAHRFAAASPGQDPGHGLDLLRRFWFDIALSGTPTALPSLLAFAAPDHILFGSDWPYAPSALPASMTALYDAHPLDDATRASIDHRAAEAMLGR